MDDAAFNEEVDGLIEWCEDLDYDKYMDEWQVLATSSKADPPPLTSEVTMLHGGLGEIQVALSDMSKTASQLNSAGGASYYAGVPG